MRVHNLTKDLVIQKVKEVFSQKEDLVHRGFCISPQCELDVVCFVLNRMPPEYVVSGRGMAHVEQDYRKNSQKITDIVALINEGLEVVTRNQRPRGNTEPSEEQLGYFWNFPSIIGRLFNGLNFEPIPDTEVFLLSEGVPVRVIDPNWQNPYRWNLPLLAPPPQGRSPWHDPEFLPGNPGERRPL